MHRTLFPSYAFVVAAWLFLLSAAQVHWGVPGQIEQVEAILVLLAVFCGGLSFYCLVRYLRHDDQV